MNKIKGDLYEKFILDYLRDKSDCNGKYVWLWSDIPVKYIINCGFITDLNKYRIASLQSDDINPYRDVGVDILQRKDNKYIFVQCKNYTGTIHVKDLSGFYMVMSNYINNEGHVYYTSKLSINIKENACNKMIKYFREPFIQSQIKTTDFKLYDFQVDAVDKLKIHFKNNNRGILHMPCGTGKTLIGCYLAKQYQYAIIISPLRHFAQQNLKRFNEYDSNYKSLVIDSDNIDNATRDVNYIREFILKNINNNILLSATFKSVDIINQVIGLFDDSKLLIIIDEFHNLSKANVIGKQKELKNETEDDSVDNDEYETDDESIDEEDQDDIYKLLNGEYHILNMSATPRIYELEDDADDDPFENLLGNIAYTMSWKDAIENEYICDYRIYVPSVFENKQEALDELHEGINIKHLKLDTTLELKCNFIINGMLYHGCKKCIAYFEDTKQLKLFYDTFVKVNDNFYRENFLIDYITYEENNKERNQSIKRFTKYDGYSILCSVRILDECIDIKQCDSVFITYNSNSKIRNMQRMSRSNRKDSDNPNKIARIFLWCDTYDKLPEFLSGLKEYDPDFKEKIKVQSSKCSHITGKQNEYTDNDTKVLNQLFVKVTEFKRVSWDEKLGMVKKYIDENGKRPSNRDNHEKIKQIGKWISTQITNYKKKTYIMKNQDIRKKWENFIKEYEQYFISNEENWNNQLSELKKYIDENGKRPSDHDKNEKIKQMSNWTSHQNTNYKKKTQIMKNQDIRTKWEDFIEEYKEYFISNEENWNNQLSELKKYIDENNKLPSTIDKNEKIKQIGTWTSNQITNYKKKTYIMKDKEIRTKWEDFIEEYQEYFN